MPKNAPPAPPAVPTETLVTTEGVTTIINPEPAAPANQETENVKDTRRPSREG